VQIRGVQRTSVDLHLYQLPFQPYLTQFEVVERNT
jgi:hypothetical protein